MRDLFRYNPPRLLKFAFRLPIYLYRFDAGWLLGKRGLMLLHRGRRSGRIYRTILEVISHNPATRESVVLSAWGEQADWYRNIQHTPALEIWTGRERYVPQQRFLPPEENYAVICDYRRRHPLAFQVFARLFRYPLRAPEPQRRTFTENLRLVTFSPKVEDKG